ncbi:hypothetical protein JDO7802_03344 [Jannaschia donghaensis]|uniref:Uncharacterized protein n=1 Tax=Jannaschia donghaensis TaxID=420998 RepID=A0A0M6YNT6_9RHOB|nr:hypothetical protein JDO7802_03344 [Jannaschia donghaensis]
MRQTWPIWCLCTALILNIFQLLASPIASVIDEPAIRAAIAEGTRAFGMTQFGSCTSQLEHIASNADPNAITIGGIQPVFLVELVLLLTTFLLIFLVYSKSQPLLAEHPEVYSTKWTLVAGLALFLVDQARYLSTSVFPETKNFFTWSSYCLQGDLSWLFDALAYVPVYFGLGFALATFIRGTGRVTPKNAILGHHSIGLASEHYLITGTFPGPLG